jgi:hypothetical protein
MSPPVRKASQAPVDWNAPIGDWELSASYDIAEQCEKARRQMIKKSEESEAWLSSKTPEPSPNPLVRPMFRELVRAEGSVTCIATSDPRLTAR